MSWFLLYRTVDCDRDVELSVDSQPRYDYQCTTDKTARSRLNIMLLVTIIIVLCAMVCVMCIGQAVARRRLFNAVRTLPSKRLPITKSDAPKGVQKLLAAECDRPGSDACFIEPAAPDTKDVLARMHLRVLVAKSHAIVERCAAETMRMHRRPNQTLREFVTELQRTHKTMDRGACERYLAGFERASCTEDLFSPEEYAAVQDSLQRMFPTSDISFTR